MIRGTRTLDAEALRALLQEARARTDPADHHLQRPQRQGRRAVGLAQAQMDTLLQRNPGTYNRLETGRYKNPPFDLLRDAALILAMNEQEWVALCRYARGEDPPAPLRSRSGLEVPGVWQDAIDGISHISYVIDSSYNLIATNRPFRAIFTGHDLPENMLEWMLFDPRARGLVLAEWEAAWAPYVLPQLRAARAHQAGRNDSALIRIERRVLADPVTARLYEERSAVQVYPDGVDRPLFHPGIGEHGTLGRATIFGTELLSNPNARHMMVLFRPGMQRSLTRRPYLRAKAS
ncbi:XRE family transcriptional regulator [Streptomyces sp. NPDC017529]|uniref:MmyB family transcriptional regulator n=1 Tax=Streptomyces sp. NPDC017529 TaxID=3365000 RepID=UPI00379D49F1